MDGDPHRCRPRRGSPWAGTAFRPAAVRVPVARPVAASRVVTSPPFLAGRIAPRTGPTWHGGLPDSRPRRQRHFAILDAVLDGSLMSAWPLLGACAMISPPDGDRQGKRKVMSVPGDRPGTRAGNAAGRTEIPDARPGGLRVRLGQMAAECDGREIALGPPRRRALLALLVMRLRTRRARPAVAGGAVVRPAPGPGPASCTATSRTCGGHWHRTHRRPHGPGSCVGCPRVTSWT